MTVGNVQDQDVGLGLQTGLGALQIFGADAERNAYAQPAFGVLGGLGVLLQFDDILGGDEADHAVICVHQRQFLDAVFVQFQPGGIKGFICGGDNQIFAPGHHGTHRCRRAGGKQQVAGGQDAEQAPAGIGHDQAANLGLRHASTRLCQAHLWADGDRVFDHETLSAFHPANHLHLAFDWHKAVQDANPTSLCHGDRHGSLSDGVHIGTHNWDSQPDTRRQPGGRVSLQPAADR